MNPNYNMNSRNGFNNGNMYWMNNNNNVQQQNNSGFMRPAQPLAPLSHGTNNQNYGQNMSINTNNNVIRSNNMSTQQYNPFSPGGSGYNNNNNGYNMNRGPMSPNGLAPISQIQKNGMNVLQPLHGVNASHSNNNSNNGHENSPYRTQNNNNNFGFHANSPSASNTNVLYENNIRKQPYPKALHPINSNNDGSNGLQNTLNRNRQLNSIAHNNNSNHNNIGHRDDNDNSNNNSMQRQQMGSTQNMTNNNNAQLSVSPRWKLASINNTTSNDRDSLDYGNNNNDYRQGSLDNNNNSNSNNAADGSMSPSMSSAAMALREARKAVESSVNGATPTDAVNRTLRTLSQTSSVTSINNSIAANNNNRMNDSLNQSWSNIQSPQYKGLSNGNNQSTSTSISEGDTRTSAHSTGNNNSNIHTNNVIIKTGNTRNEEHSPLKNMENNRNGTNNDGVSQSNVDTNNNKDELERNSRSTSPPLNGVGVKNQGSPVSNTNNITLNLKNSNMKAHLQPSLSTSNSGLSSTPNKPMSPLSTTSGTTSNATQPRPLQSSNLAATRTLAPISSGTSSNNSNLLNNSNTQSASNNNNNTNKQVRLSATSEKEHDNTETTSSHTNSTTNNNSNTTSHGQQQHSSTTTQGHVQQQQSGAAAQPQPQLGTTGAAPAKAPVPASDGSEDVLALFHKDFQNLGQVQAVGAVSWRGRNPTFTKINQDAVVVAEHGPTSSLLVAIFDGHGVNGREVSAFFKEKYPLALFTDKRFQNARVGHMPQTNSMSSYSDDDGTGSVGSQSSPNKKGVNKPKNPNQHQPSTYLCDVMTDVLMATEVALIQASGINCSLSGCTAVIVLVRDGYLNVINVGDSRGILVQSQNPIIPISMNAYNAAASAATNQGSPVPALLASNLNNTSGLGSSNSQILNTAAAITSAVLDATPITNNSVKCKVLTVDHKPDLPKEKQRIIACGGRVMSTRVKGAPNLLGPPRVWLRNAALPGLNMSRALGDLVAKQAGVISSPFKLVQPLAMLDRSLVIASDGLWDFVVNEEVSTVALSSNDCWEAAARLAKLARARWLVRTGGADDTTVVVVRFKLPSTKTG